MGNGLPQVCALVRNDTVDVRCDCAEVRSFSGGVLLGGASPSPTACQLPAEELRAVRLRMGRAWEGMGFPFQLFERSGSIQRSALGSLFFHSKKRERPAGTDKPAGRSLFRRLESENMNKGLVGGKP